MLVIALGFGALTALANIAGSYLATLHRSLPPRYMAALLGLGGGFILGAALIEMLPETLERQPGLTMPLLVGAGYLLIFALEQLFSVHLHLLSDEEEPGHTAAVVTHTPLLPGRKAKPQLIPVATGLAALVAFNVHDLFDGLAIGSGMTVDAQLGTLVFVAVVLHEVPAGLVVGSLALAAGKGRKEALLAGVSIGLITLVGIVIPFWLGDVSTFMGDAMLAIATGTFIYVGATILIPLSESGRSRLVTLSVVLGFGVFALTAWLAERSFNG
jgi:zinc transporter ZupT